MSKSEKGQETLKEQEEKNDKCSQTTFHEEHEEHQCKECQMKLPTFMDLLSHIAKQHLEEKIEGEENHENEDPKFEDNIDSSFVFHESMLDEFIEKLNLSESEMTGGKDL